MVYLFLADGFEETEALCTADILRRCGLNVQMLSVTGRRVVEGAHNIVVKADSLFRRNHTRNAEALIVPGGMKGAQTLNANPLVLQTLAYHAVRGTFVAAICAGPMVLDSAQLLRHKHFTCYPSLETGMDLTATYHADHFAVRHDNIITGAGPAATACFAFTIAEALAAPDIVEQVKADMLFPQADIPQNRALYFRGDSDVPYVPAAPMQKPAAATAAPMPENRIFHGADADELIF